MSKSAVAPSRGQDRHRPLPGLWLAAALIWGCHAGEGGDPSEAALYQYEGRRFRSVVEQPVAAPGDLRLRVEPVGGWKLSPRYPVGLLAEQFGSAASAQEPLRLAAADALRLDEQVLEFPLPRPTGGGPGSASRLAATVSFAVCKGERCERVKHPFELTLSE